MEFEKKITPEEQAQIDKTTPDTNPEDWEKRFKDTQASFTQAQQEKYELARLLVDENPKNVEKIPDEKVMKKVLQEKWWVENLDELKSLYPKALSKKSKDEDDDEDNELETLKQKVKLIEYKETKTKMKDTIELIKKDNSNIVSGISDFESKLTEELKYISTDLPVEERVKRAYKLVVDSNISTAQLYALMQWASKQKEEFVTNDGKFLKDQNDLRRLLGLKQK